MIVLSDNGFYRADNLPAGECTVVISHPWPMSQVVEVADGREVVANFSYEQGSATIKGLLIRPEKKEKHSFDAVMLYKPGTCGLKAEAPYIRPNFSDGVYSRLYTDEEGKIHRIGHLPAKSFDVVAVLVNDGKVVRIDMERIKLNDGVTTHVTLDLSDE